MLFPTIEFGVFFAVVFPLAWALNGHNGLKKLFLVACSYLFYGCWRPEFTVLLFASSTLNFAIGWAFGRARSRPARRLLLWTGVALNLGSLGYFKYYNFLSAELSNVAASFGLTLDLGETDVALPVAISFLTFHGLSYIIDVYRGTTAPCTRFVDLLLYISFFPHLVAGPIVRAADFLDQLARPSDPRRIELGASVLAIVGGLFKKVVVASHLSTLFVDPVFANPAAHGRLDLVLAAYAYAIVIYCDFSAYTDMARGVANLLGYRFPANFDQPYRALSLQEFWRRWHITLSGWLRDYVYVPLGGSRGGAFATGRNLIVTMLLGGLWHGAGLQFLAWGALHGFGLALERMLQRRRPHGTRTGGRMPAWLRWAVTFNVVCLGWVFFRAPSFADAAGYLRAIADGADAPPTLTPFVLVLMAVGFATQFVPAWTPGTLANLYDRVPLPAKIAVPAGGVWLVSLLAPAGIAPFIYFQF